MTPKPEVLSLLEKLQNFTPSEVDEERGSFKIGDSVIYNMLGGALSNSDLVKTLGISEHTLRVRHNGAVAKIVETAGEEVSRYNIVFEDGFTIKDVATSELKAPEPSGTQPKPQEEPDLDAEVLHLEDYSKDDLEKVKSKSAETGDAIKKVEDDELKIAPDKVKGKKESKQIREEKCPKCGSDSFAEGNEAGDYMCAECGYDESVGEAKLKEGRQEVIDNCVRVFDSPGGTVQQKIAYMKTKGATDNEITQALDIASGGEVVRSALGGAEESKLKEEETEFTPSRVEFKKIGDEKLGLLLKNARRSYAHWEKDGTEPEKVAAGAKAVARYEEEMVSRGLMSGKSSTSEKKEFTFSFMQKQEPLWLCNECHKTFRSGEAICTLCPSKKEAERIVEQAKEVFQVTWKNTDTGKEESTRVMAYDKTDAKREAKRSNREITKVEGPITEEPRREAKVPFDESSEGTKEEKYYVFYNDYATKPPTRTRIKKVFIAKSKSDAADQGQKLLQKEAPEGEWEVIDAEVLEERERKVTEDDPITAIEIVTSKLDPDAYNIRVVQLPEGSIVILDSVSDREAAIERGKEFASDLKAKFLGIIDEPKLKEQEEDTFTTVVKGIVDKDLADKIATEKEGQVIADEEDGKKFAVLVKKDE